MNMYVFYLGEYDGKQISRVGGIGGGELGRTRMTGLASWRRRRRIREGLALVWAVGVEG